ALVGFLYIKKSEIDPSIQNLIDCAIKPNKIHKIAPPLTTVRCIWSNPIPQD
mgnify:CR=1